MGKYGLGIASLAILAVFIVVHFLIERQYAKEERKPPES